MPDLPLESEWRRAIVIMSRVVVFSLVLFLANEAKIILIPIALGIFLAFVLSPVVRWMQSIVRFRIPAVLAAVGVALAIFCSQVGSSGAAQAQLSDVASYKRQYARQACNRSRAYSRRPR